MLTSMRRPSRLGNAWLGACLLLAAMPAGARELRVSAASLQAEAAQVSRIEARLTWSDDGPGSLVLTAGRVEIPALAESFSDLEWRCDLTREQAGRWHCEGPVRSDRGRAIATVAMSSADLEARLGIGKAALSVATRAGAPDDVAIGLQAVPVAWLQGFLTSLWAEGQWTSGRVDGHVDLHLPAAAPARVRADLRLADLGLETPDGWLAAAGVRGRLRLAQTGDRSEVRFEARGGEFLAQGLYAQLPETPVVVEATVVPEGEGWNLPAFAWRDGEVLQASGAARLAPDGTPSDLRLQLSLGDLAAARDRYLSGFLAPAGFPDLVLAGGAAARLDLRDGEWQAITLSFDRLNAIDPRQRFTLAGLHGDLGWRAGDEPHPGTLAWDSAALFGIGLGHAALGFESREGQLRLAAPVDIAALGGKIRLDHLRWQPPGGGRGARFQLGTSLLDLDLGSLSQRLGWPPFTGTLGGRIPQARYENNVLTLDGGLAMQAFGGTVSLSSLVMERPFGVAPTLSADVAIDDVDMAPMTDAFGFGSISGRMDGYIRNLRMVDWSPVAFDAWIGSDPAWKGRRRLSQRAVEDISKVGGGGGLMGGLQAQALRLFDDFRYERLGLGCRLRDNVCAMSGVDSAGDGYTIVQGAGLPRIQVVGFRRRVDWPTLVARLKAATEGQTPVIQ